MKEKSIIADLQQKIALYEDMNAYRALYELLNERLFWFVYSFVKSREAAEEIVSDVFIKLWTIRNELPSIANLQVYLYVIAKNFSKNYIIREYKYPHVCLDEIPLDATTSVNPEELYISAEMAGRINHAIRELPPQCRLIFQMAREHGLKHQEVADILGISRITVRNQLTIAARKIAQSVYPHLQPAAAKQQSRC
ncbi:RNA polymerase sigma-70 factor [Chitinophaga japonensis]|uniref:RNA polymerase sigma-70 factor (ECF subfamily) n=1 Tax=Chitinophaga japonensis TaxID=104662 RepID=A0A562T305_CHIJA|nr:RNA polymerase sigma-70 factor [Chitinophaga japonensis]TWI87987.1 RNA polymerase sigma-70 factor (ECF subfamily) [Chitinophaga japonensis]